MARIRISTTPWNVYWTVAPFTALITLVCPMFLMFPEHDGADWLVEARLRHWAGFVLTSAVVLVMSLSRWARTLPGRIAIGAAALAVLAQLLLAVGLQVETGKGHPPAMILFWFPAIGLVSAANVVAYLSLGYAARAGESRRLVVLTLITAMLAAMSVISV